MKAAWNWFLAHGDKILVVATAFVTSLQTTGALPVTWAPAILSGLAWIHMTFLPEPASGTPVNLAPASNVAKIMPFLIMALFLGTVTVSLQGCQALGLAPAQTFNEKLAAGYGAVQAIATTTDSLLKAGKITPKVAANISNQDQNLLAALNIASSVEATNVADGGNLLTTAVASITALTTYLTTLQPVAK